MAGSAGGEAAMGIPLRFRGPFRTGPEKEKTFSEDDYEKIAEGFPGFNRPGFPPAF